MAKKRYNLGDFKERAADNGIEIELPDGSLLDVPALELWPDKVVEMAERDPLGAARSILGEAEYERYAEQGGNATLLLKIVQEAFDLVLPESPASSDS